MSSTFQLSSLCNWLPARGHPVYKIPSLGIKNTSLLLWSSANYCSISQNMRNKHPVAAQHKKTNKEVWTWKDDWPSWRTSTYERPFTQEGNYLVIISGQGFWTGDDHLHLKCSTLLIRGTLILTLIANGDTENFDHTSDIRYQSLPEHQTSFLLYLAPSSEDTACDLGVFPPSVDISVVGCHGLTSVIFCNHTSYWWMTWFHIVPLNFAANHFSCQRWLLLCQHTLKW